MNNRKRSRWTPVSHIGPSLKLFRQTLDNAVWKTAILLPHGFVTLAGSRAAATHACPVFINGQTRSPHRPEDKIMISGLYWYLWHQWKCIAYVCCVGWFIYLFISFTVFMLPASPLDFSPLAKLRLYFSPFILLQTDAVTVIFIYARV